MISVSLTQTHMNTESHRNAPINIRVSETTDVVQGKCGFKRVSLVP